MNMRFTVLISVYSRDKEELLIDAIDSIICQTLKPTEIVLVKDGQLTNELNGVIEQYSFLYPNLFKVISLNKNVGLGTALRIGLKHCSYEYVARMDADDISKPNRFEKLVFFAHKYPNVDLIGSWIEEFKDNNKGNILYRKVPEFLPDILNRSKWRSPVNHVSVLFKKSSVLQSGSYQHFPLLEDYYLWFRMLKHNCVFYNIQESLVQVRVGSDMIGRRWGIKYLLTEYKLFWYMYKEGFINIWVMFANQVIRLPLRLFPKIILHQFYNSFLRN